MGRKFVRKIERDQALRTMSKEARLDFGRVLQEIRSEAKSAGGKTSRKEVLATRRSQYPAELLTRLDAVMQRDDMGPKEGETPPDFSLKRMERDERVLLSSFSGRRPVALVFGSYT